MCEIRSPELQIEVCQNPYSTLSSSVIEEHLENYFRKVENLNSNEVLYDTVLPTDINYVRICSDSGKNQKISYLSAKTVKKYHIYKVWDNEPECDFLDDHSQVPASLNWCLPNAAFEGLWENLFIDNRLKETLLSYVQTTLLYSNKKVNAQLVRWNGLVLLHGFPGSGKTSLCKALVQKLSIRQRSRYRNFQLIEVNTHSLFSKWFSESSKLVLKFFASIKEILVSDCNFVCVLIDEVESLTQVRESKGNEPSDSIRVVNTVLTQIDQLQRFPNFLILATSNISSTIDSAFADRADLKLFISYPSPWEIYEILRSCLEELISHDLVRGNKNGFFDAVIFESMSSDEENGFDDTMNEMIKYSKALSEVSALCVSLSGRTIRKIPFLTSAMFINKSTPNVIDFLEEMREVVRRYKSDESKFYNSSSNILNSLITS